MIGLAMHEMLDSLRPELNLSSEDPATPEVSRFFKLLKDSEESLHEHTDVSILAFVTRLMAIKSKYFFSNNCYNEILKLLGDVLPKPNKLPKDMYHSKIIIKGLGIDYEKIDVCKNNCMLFMKEHAGEKKCLKCGQSRFVEVVNDEGDKVLTDVAHKQLRYLSLTPRVKQLFLSKKPLCTCDGSITNILYLQQSWFPEQAQQQPFVFPQFQSSMPQWGLHAPPPPPPSQVLQFS
jgi:hypothetical protein